MSGTSNWITWRLEECCDILDSKRVPVNSEERDNRPGNIPYYGANGIQGFIDDFIFDEPLILIAEDGGRFDEFSRRAIAYRIHGKSWVNNHAHVLRAKSEFCQDTIFYTLEHKDIQSFIVGGTRSKLNQKALRSIEIMLPKCANEQSKIAEVLTTVDQAIEQTEALIAKQQRIKTGLMQELLTRGIDEHGNLRSEETHEFKDSPLGRIPVEWDVKTIEDLLGNIIDYRGRTPLKSEHGVPLITAKNVRNGWLEEEPKEFIKSRDYKGWMTRGIPSSGDVLFTTEAPMGNAARVPDYKIALAQRLLSLSPNKTLLSQDFLYWILHWKDSVQRLEVMTSGSTVVGIKQSVFRKMLFSVPSTTDEQDDICRILSTLQTKMDGLEKENAKYRSLKTGLMQDLLTGEVPVTPLLELAETA